MNRTGVPRYNIAPTQPVPVIRQHPKEPVRELSLIRWGLYTLRGLRTCRRAMMINARSNGENKPSDPRCGEIVAGASIPADGFYQWQKAGKAKALLL